MTEQIVLWFRRQQNTSALSVEFSFSQLWASLLSLILFFLFFGLLIRSPGKVTSGPLESFWLGCVAVVVEWCHLIGW